MADPLVAPVFACVCSAGAAWIIGGQGVMDVSGAAGTPFMTVTLPLMKPGLANAFLVGFIESIADFGNPIVVGGRYGLSSKDFNPAQVKAVLLRL